VPDARARTLITVEELARLLDAGQALVLLDVLDEQGALPENRPKIPGALSVHLATDFSGKPTPVSGRRPLPELHELQSKVRDWGIRAGSTVVVYDNAGGAQASRAWWTLRWAGLTTVRVLDGGFSAWTAAGHASSTQVATAAAGTGDVVLTAGGMPTIDADQATALADQGRLFDARPRSSYVGDPGKAGTGHIPGAIHVAAADNLTAGRFKSDAELRASFAPFADGAPVGVYCGSGNSAAHAIAAMHSVGLNPALYVGSWSAWSADMSRPVAIGPKPR
jgi:thiosulfate/3-mercaptopyruvate sulfurtransferase